MTPTEERMQRFLDQITLERMHAAWSDGAIVGGAAAFTFNVTVPGGDLPTAGVSVVGVYPTHRRRGVLRALMRAQLDDAHDRGEALAALWASEESIYGRFGYGLSSFCGEINLAHEHTALAHLSEPAGTMRFLEPEEALDAIPPVFERIR
ncbi:MAG: GNAT family N-acetyltransferase, partial [Actinobacteria bacterium]